MFYCLTLRTLVHNITLKPKVHVIARLLFCFQILIDSGVTTVERGDFEPTSIALELTCLRYQDSVSVVATTHQNGTHSLLTSAKLSDSYLVVGITRKLNKEPSLYYPLYIYMAPGSCYNNIYPALKSMHLPHVLLLILMCFP